MKKGLLFTFIAIVLFIAVLAINLLLFNKNAAVISEGDPIPDYEQNRPALIVVDIQEGTTGSVSVTKSYILQSEWLLPRINRLIRIADSLEIPVVYIRNEVTNPLINVLNNTMAEGSEGAGLDQRLNVISDHVITKKKNDAFSNPELDELLAEYQVNHIFLAGLDAAYCVNSTMLGALNRGYQITVVEDAVIADTEESWNEMIKLYSERGAGLIESDEYILSTTIKQ